MTTTTNGNGNGTHNPVIRNDGTLINVLTGMGTSRDKSEFTGVGPAAQLEQEQQMQLAQNAFMGRVCMARPDSATQRWCEITLPEVSADEKVIEAFNDYRNTIGGETEDEEMISDRDIFAWAGYLANVHRGSAIVLDVDDGLPPSEPINTKRIRSIVSAQVLDSYKIIPDLTSTNIPWNATHYDILLSTHDNNKLAAMGERVRKKGNSSLSTYRVHRSRILRIPGVPIPTDLMLRNQGWDRSLIEQVWEEFRAWKSSYTDAGSLIHDYSLFVYTLKGLGDMVIEGQENDLRARLQVLRMMTTVLGGAAIDDTEKIEFVDRQLGGIDSLLDRFRDLWIGATGIPHTILFGESPSGLGATGESEEKTWAEAVEKYQTRVFLPRLKRLYRLIWLAKDGPTNGEEPKGWGIKFLPLRQQSEEERLAGLSSFTGAISTAINAGWLLPEEARLSFKGGKVVYDIILDDEAWQKKQESEQQGGFDFGSFGGGAEGAPPAEPPPEEGAEPPAEEPIAPEEVEGTVQQDSYRTDRGEQFADQTVYEQAYQAAKRKFKLPSAYRSGWMVQEYKRLYKEKHGNLEGAFTRRDDLNQWFKEEKWVRISSSGEILGPCGDRSEQEGKPKCLPAQKAQAMSKDNRKKIVARKRRNDPDADREGSAVNVSSKTN